MGINDISYNENIVHIKKNSIASKFNIYKLFLLLKKHISSLPKKNLLYADDLRNINYIDELEKNMISNNYEKVIELSEKLLKQHTENEQIYSYYINSLNQYSDKRYNIEHSITEEERTKYKRKIVELSKNLINKNCKTQLLKDCYTTIFFHGTEDEKSFYANKLAEQNLEIIDSNLYFLINKYIKNEQKEKILHILEEKSTDISYGFLAINALEQKDYKKAN